MTGEDFWIFSKNGVLRKNQAVFYHILTKNLLESGIRRHLRPVRVPADGAARGRVPRSAAKFRGLGALKWGGRQAGCRAAPASAARDRPKAAQGQRKAPLSNRKAVLLRPRGAAWTGSRAIWAAPPASLAAAPQHFPDLLRPEIAQNPEAGRLRSGRSRGVRIRSGEGPGRRRREGRPYQRIRSQRARVPPIRTARSAAPRTVSRNEERDVHPLAPRRP